MKILIENFRKYLEEEVGGFTTPYQLFVPTGCDDGTCSIDELKNTPPIENRPGTNKPFGGLWTSTAWEVPYTKGSPKGTWTSEWNEWLPGNMPHWMSPQGILIVPKTDNIFHVSTEEDAAQLYEEFPLGGGKNILDAKSCEAEEIARIKALPDSAFDIEDQEKHKIGQDLHSQKWWNSMTPQQKVSKIRYGMILKAQLSCVEKTDDWSLGGRKETKFIDFEAALQKYDAIHYGAPSGKDSNAWNFGSSGAWDVESTVFRDTSVVDIIKVVPVKQSDDF